MAFLEKEKTLIFELLGMFQGGTFDWFDYNAFITGQITSVPFGNQVDFATAKTVIDSNIADIVASGDGREARIKEILVEYDCISLQEIEIRTGGARDNAGIRYKTSSQELKLRDKLERHIGIHVALTGIPTSASRGDNGRSISLGR